MGIINLNKVKTPMTDFTSTIAPVCAYAVTGAVPGGAAGVDVCGSSTISTVSSRVGDLYSVSSETTYTWPAAVTFDPAT